jgi:hypothetical protein
VALVGCAADEGKVRGRNSEASADH